MLPLIPIIISVGSSSILAYRHFRAHRREIVSKYLREYLLGSVSSDLEIPQNFDANTFTINDDPLFIYGITHNRFSICDMLLSMKADTTVHDKDGNSPLHIATRKNHYELMRKLIHAKANVNAMNNLSMTPLFFAQTQTAFNLLLNAGAYPDAQDISGKTALFYIKSPELGEFLIDRGASRDIRDLEGKEAPILKQIKTKIVKKDFHHLPPESQNALISAMIEHNSEKVENMVSTVVTPNFSMYHKGKQITALRFSILEHDCKTAKVLLKYGALPEDDEFTPIIYPALELNDPEIIKLLIQSGVHPIGAHLSFAIHHDFVQAAITLVPYCKSDFVFYDQRLPGLRNVLEIAIMKNQPEVVEEIMKNGGNPNAFYQTVDMVEYAYKHNFYEIYQILCKYGFKIR